MREERIDDWMKRLCYSSFVTQSTIRLSRDQSSLASWTNFRTNCWLISTVLMTHSIWSSFINYCVYTSVNFEWTAGRNPTFELRYSTICSSIRISLIVLEVDEWNYCPIDCLLCDVLLHRLWDDIDQQYEKLLNRFPIRTSQIWCDSRFNDEIRITNSKSQNSSTHALFAQFVGYISWQTLAHFQSLVLL